MRRELARRYCSPHIFCLALVPVIQAISEESGSDCYRLRPRGSMEGVARRGPDQPLATDGLPLWNKSIKKCKSFFLFLQRHLQLPRSGVVYLYWPFSSNVELLLPIQARAHDLGP